MTESGGLQTEESPVDLTAELPLDDEDVLAEPPPSFWRRNRWPLGAVGVVVVAAAIALPLWLTSSSAAPVGFSVTTVTVPVTTGTIQQTVTSSGTIEPASQATLNFVVSGTVTAVNVKAGQTVTAGQTLATVDATALTEQVNAAQAQLTAANDRLASDEANNASTSQIDSDQSSITAAESSLSTAQTNLSDASLTSTIAGTVASVNLTIGQQVSGSGTGNGTGGTGSNGTGSTGSNGSSSGEIEVIGTGSYIVKTTVDDTQIGQITDGDQAVITPSSSSSRAGGSTTTVYGTVGSMSLIGSQSSNVTTFPVTINVTGDPQGLYAGASADVSIIVKQLNNVTEVPTQAISYNSSGQAYVTEVVNGAHVVTDVTVGAAENGETQIISGVAPGAKVLERQIKFNAPGGGTGGLFGGNGGTRGFPGGGGGFFQRGTGGGTGGGAFPVTSGS
jgi:membrane fusion protein, macrolide-specific efflux system